MPAAVELQRRVVTGSAPGPHLLITGGVHGDEFEPMAAVRRLMRQVEPARLRGSVTLVPVVNQAAFARGQRTADDGLDLARVCPGDPDGSITRRTAHALSELIRAADFYIDLHTGGTTMQILPLAGYALVRDPRVLDAQRRTARAFDLPLIWGTTARLEGRSLSVARDAGVPAIYAEWGGGGTCGVEGVAGYVQGCLNVMAELGMIDPPPRPPASRVRHVVEDDRDHSGHLQLHNPSPAEGFFTPAVGLGQTIRQGDAIGEVCDVLGERPQTVTAAAGGLVILVRTFPRVARGDPLAAVVNLDGAKEAER